MSVQGNPNLISQHIPAGTFIFVEGDNEAHFYIIQKGEVEIFTLVDGKTIPIAKCTEGESFGEFALLMDAPRSASARALTDCEVIKVTKAGYEELLEQLPGWANCMLQNFAKRLTSMNETLKKSPQFIKS